MRRFFTIIAATLLLPLLTSGQESDYWVDYDLLIRQGEYYRIASFDLNTLDAGTINRRVVDKGFKESFDLKYSSWVNSYTDVFKGEIYDFTVKGTEMEFPKITYNMAFECRDGRMTITLYSVWPGTYRYSKVSPWVMCTKNLYGGEDVLRAKKCGSRFRRWQIELIKYMDAFFRERADKMKDFILTHPSEWEKPKIEMREMQ